MRISPLKKYRLPLYLSSWITFAISLTLYWITVDPGVSYWDCPEYITTASRLEVGHPPGNPIWMLAMRVVTIPFDNIHHALVINLCSGALMAFAAFFLCRIIFIPVRFSLQRFILRGYLSRSGADVCAAFICIGASLCFSFCDSAWFSAVEAEVYALSIFLSALSLWIMILWWYESDKGAQTRLLIFLAYLTGISLGVHQLNLLLIPVFGLIIFYRFHRRRVSPIWPFLIVVACGAVIGLILMILLPSTLWGASGFELWTVNTLGMPYNSGVIIFAGLIFILLLILLFFTSRVPSKGNHLNTAVWMVTFILLGFSSFGVIWIRSMASPFMNEGTPDNIFSLKSYIEREQYPSSPLIYGHTPYSKPLFTEEYENGVPKYSRYLLEKGKARYSPVLPDAELNHRSHMLSHKDSAGNLKVTKQGRGYLLTDYDFKQILTPELNMWFPRLTSRQPSDILAYEDWSGMSKETMLYIPVSETIDSMGNFLTRKYPSGSRPIVYSYKPTYAQNFRFFLSYQAYYMYFRYLFWNFIGRQNDFHSTGEIEHGNFVTGIPYIDRRWLGITDQIPQEIWKENKGRNRYFGIPFAFGILGIITLACGNRRSRRWLTIIAIIFLMTGLAIVVYLNQSPGEPRERDYTFLGSYMAFCMWIAAGFTAIAMLLAKSIKRNAAVIVISLISLCPPTLMALENFDDHDRRGRYQTSYFASTLLDFEYPAIIFTHGDNVTFPVWYATEVENLGTHHTPVDLTYLSLPDYVINLKKQGDKGIKTIGNSSQLSYGRYLFSRIPTDTVFRPLPLEVALKLLYESKEEIPLFPTSFITIPSSLNDSITIDLHDLTRGSSYLPFRQLMLLDFIATQLSSENPKILYFPGSIEHRFYNALEPALQPVLAGQIYAPWLNDSSMLDLLKLSTLREINKLNNIRKETRYMDPVITDRTRRYRGELIIAANDLFQRGDTAVPVKVSETILEILPYHELLPGDFTVADSTYYEGKEFSKLLKRLYSATGNPKYLDASTDLDSLISKRHKEWLRYYHSLSPEQRATFSNRSRRLLIK